RDESRFHSGGAGWWIGESAAVRRGLLTRIRRARRAATSLVAPSPAGRLSWLNRLGRPSPWPGAREVPKAKDAARSKARRPRNVSRRRRRGGFEPVVDVSSGATRSGSAIPVCIKLDAVTTWPRWGQAWTDERAGLLIAGLVLARGRSNEGV